MNSRLNGGEFSTASKFINRDFGGDEFVGRAEDFGTNAFQFDIMAQNFDFE